MRARGHGVHQAGHHLVRVAGIGMLALNGPDALRVFDTNAVGIIRVSEAALPLLRRSENPVAW